MSTLWKVLRHMAIVDLQKSEGWSKEEATKVVDEFGEDGCKRLENLYKEIKEKFKVIHKKEKERRKAEKKKKLVKESLEEYKEEETIMETPLNEEITGDYKVRVTPEREQSFEGDIIVTDPCYFIPDNLWQKIIDEFWFPKGEGTGLAEAGTIYVEPGIKILYSSTAYGDGQYAVQNRKGESVHNNSTGVDAGMIAIISVEDVKRLNPEFEVDNKWYPRINGFYGTVSADGKGNFIGDIEIDTEGKESYEDYDEDEEYLEESLLENNNQFFASEKALNKALDAPYFTRALSMYAQDITKDDSELSIWLKQIARSISAAYPDTGDISISNVFRIVDDVMYGEDIEEINRVKEDLDFYWSSV